MNNEETAYQKGIKARAEGAKITDNPFLSKKGGDSMEWETGYLRMGGFLSGYTKENPAEGM